MQESLHAGSTEVAKPGGRLLGQLISQPAQLIPVGKGIVRKEEIGLFMVAAVDPEDVSLGS